MIDDTKLVFVNVRMRTRTHMRKHTYTHARAHVHNQHPHTHTYTRTHAWNHAYTLIIPQCGHLDRRSSNLYAVDGEYEPNNDRTRKVSADVLATRVLN